jgi:hypothetical protein
MKRREIAVESWLDESYAYITRRVGKERDGQAGTMHYRDYGILQRAIINASSAIARGDALRAVYEISKYWRVLSTLDDPELVRKFLKGFSATGGTGKRGRRGALWLAIERICKEINSRHWDDVLLALDNADLMADVYHAASNPIDIEVTEVDELDKFLRYRTRGGADKEVSFARLKNILAEIKI